MLSRGMSYAIQGKIKTKLHPLISLAEYIDSFACNAIVLIGAELNTSSWVSGPPGSTSVGHSLPLLVLPLMTLMANKEPLPASV